MGPNPPLKYDQPKRAVAVLDYTFDWTAWLAPIADSIASVTFSIAPIGSPQSGDCTLVAATPPWVGGTTSCWVSAGVVGFGYQVTCTITTTGGTAGVPRTDSRQASLFVVA